MTYHHDEEEEATIALEARERQTVRLMSFAKQLHVGTTDEIAGLLWVYLTQGARGGCLDARYAQVVERIRGELQTFLIASSHAVRFTGVHLDLKSGVSRPYI